MKLCPARDLRGVAAPCSTPTPHPSPSQLRINSTNVKTIRLNCDCTVSCRTPLPMPPFGCAVARATGERRMRRMLLCIPGSRARLGAPAAGVALTPSSPEPPVLPPKPRPTAALGDRWLQLRVLGQLPSNVQQCQIHLQEVRP